MPTSDLPSAPAPRTLVPRLQVLAAALLFSSGGAAIKAVHLTSWQVACFRSAVAALALLLLMPEARRRPNLRILGVGAIHAATFILFVQANKLTTAAGAIFLQATAPLYVLLFSPWLLKERVRGADIFYMGALALGLGCFFLGLDPVSATAPNPLLGNVLAALSGLCWGLTIMGLRALGRAGGEGGGSPATAVVWGNAFAFAACLPWALPVAETRPADWAVIAFLGLFQVAVAYVFLTRGIGKVRAIEASLLLLLEPVLNPLWAWIVHGEQPGGWSVAGGAVILAATAAKSWWDVRRAAAPAPV